jgi:hypothetical protein
MCRRDAKTVQNRYSLLNINFFNQLYAMAGQDLARRESVWRPLWEKAFSKRVTPYISL